MGAQDIFTFGVNSGASASSASLPGSNPFGGSLFQPPSQPRANPFSLGATPPPAASGNVFVFGSRPAPAYSQEAAGPTTASGGEPMFVFGVDSETTPAAPSCASGSTEQRRRRLRGPLQSRNARARWSPPSARAVDAGFRPAVGGFAGLAAAGDSAPELLGGPSFAPRARAESKAPGDGGGAGEGAAEAPATPRDAWAKRAEEFLARGEHGSAARVLMQHFDALDTGRSARAELELFGRIVSSWESHDQQAIKTQDSERNVLNARLQGEKSTVQQLKEHRAKAEDDLWNEIRLRKNAEARTADLSVQLREQLEEMSFLRQRCFAAQRELAAANKARAEAERRAERPRECSQDEVIRRLSQLECFPLRRCDDRPMLRKRILLKWHPDKQPSQEHKVLATQVMQELQNQPEWSW